MEENCNLTPKPLDDNGDGGCYHSMDRFMSAVNSAMEWCEKCERQNKCEMETDPYSNHEYECKHDYCGRLIKSKHHYKPSRNIFGVLVHVCTMCDKSVECFGTKQIKWHNPRKTSPCQRFSDYESVIWRCGDSEESVCGKSCGRDLVQIVNLNAYCCHYESDITKTMQWTILLDTKNSPSQVMKEYRDKLAGPDDIDIWGTPLDFQGQTCYRHHQLENEYEFPCSILQQKCKHCGKRYLNMGISSHIWTGPYCEHCHGDGNTKYPVEL